MIRQRPKEINESPNKERVYDENQVTPRGGDWSRFNTSVTQMVQNIGNTWQAGYFDSLPDAVEKSRTNEPKKRVCVESDLYQEF